jgi:hypothetical protein
VKASDGRLLETWSGASGAAGVLIAMGKIFIAGSTNPGALYQIDPTQSAGAVSTISSDLGIYPGRIAFDGQRIWTANSGTGVAGSGSVSIVTLNPSNVTTVSTGMSRPSGIIYDGTNMWVTDVGDSTLKRLDSVGIVVQTVSFALGSYPQSPAFDGTNFWIPFVESSNVVVVRAVGVLAGTQLSIFFGGAREFPTQAAFDGERILVTNGIGDSVSLWRATDLTRIGTVSTGTGTNPSGACSDGLNFWITLQGTGKLARF